MAQILYIAMGGAAGAVSRYLLGRLIDGQHNSLVPWGTFIVNLVGAVLIGVLYVLITEKQILHPDLKMLLMVGLLGGFTTYSAFSLESFRLIENGHLLLAGGYMLGTTAICLCGVWLGSLATRTFF